MTPSRSLVAVCCCLLGLGFFQAPGRSEDAAPAAAAPAEAAPEGDVALGTASLKKTTERVTAMLKELPERCAKQVEGSALEQLPQYGPRVFEAYMALRVPIEVMAVQSALLAADRVGAETVLVDGPALLKGRLQQAFGVNWEDVDKLHAQKLAWSEIALALTIAKATEKKVDDLVAQVKDGKKTWPEVAVAAGLQGGKLAEIIAPLFRAE